MLQLHNWTGQAAKVWDGYRKLPDRFGREYDEVFAKLVHTETIESWEAFLRWSGELRGWGFRGQCKAGWPLQTSLERAVRVEYSYGGSCGHTHLDRGEEARELLRRFQDQAWRYLPGPMPQDGDVASWLALMQHCGVPTRLLDWTDSDRVALYFALEERASVLSGTPFPGESATVWAIDLDWLESGGREIFPMAIQTVTRDNDRDRIAQLNAVLGQAGKPLIVRIDPLRDNPRMVAQRGFFLWKLFELTPYFDQILTTMIVHPHIPELPVIRKAVIPARLHNAFVGNLAMAGVNRASLFPAEGYDVLAGCGKTR